MAPILTGVSERLARLSSTVIGYIDANRGLVVAVAAAAAGLVGVGGSLVALGIGVQVLGVAVGGLAALWA